VQFHYVHNMMFSCKLKQIMLVQEEEVLNYISVQINFYITSVF
jgi:hypothetical protein